MRITLSDAGKRFNREWIFRHFTYAFQSGNAYAITGTNGSGKSTLLQVIGGAMIASEGSVDFGNGIASADHFKMVSLCGPFVELIEEMTAIEFLRFHAVFKPLLKGITPDNVLDVLGLTAAADKQIHYFSSGMKQRIKLAQAIFSAVPVVLLDEPCSNLDAPGIALYHQLIGRYVSDRLVIVSSNDPQEYTFCREQINIMAYK